MVKGIGQAGLSRAALDSAIARMQARKQELRATLSGTDGAPNSQSAFGELVSKGVGGIDSSIKRAEGAHLEVLQGGLDFHEVAALLKQSQLSFDFAMQVRNKLVEAYREVMRMGV